MDTKICVECVEEKPLSEFTKETFRQVYKNKCKTCSAAIQRMNRQTGKWQKSNDNYVVARSNYLKKKYGMYMPEYDALLLEQGEVCAICGKTNANGKLLAVDHNHLTGRVRGLLCSNCNTGLGLLQDDADILRKALDYLAKHTIE